MPDQEERSRILRNLEGMLMFLTPREKKIIQMRFGLLDGKAHNLTEVGKEYGVTGDRIRQIEAKIVGKLRRDHPTSIKIEGLEHVAALERDPGTKEPDAVANGPEAVPVSTVPEPTPNATVPELMSTPEPVVRVIMNMDRVDMVSAILFARVLQKTFFGDTLRPLVLLHSESLPSPPTPVVQKAG